MQLLVIFALVVTASCQSTHAPDHLLTVLKAIHNSHIFHQLPTAETYILIELISAAEVDQITHYIDGVGFARILLFLDHVEKIDQREAHLLETLLVKELNEERPGSQTTAPNVLGKRANLHTMLQNLQNSHSYQNLSQADQELMVKLIKAAQDGTVTPLVHQVGYATVIALVDHITDPAETHRFLTYLIQHMNQETGHVHPQPVGK